MRWRPSPDLAVRVLAPPVSVLARSWRFEVHNRERWQCLHRARQPFLFLLWHEALLPLLWHHRDQGIAILVSEARDGRILSEYAARLGYRHAAGSSTRGGMLAFLQAARLLEEGIPVAITPDGPRGPRRVVKPGILAAAQRVGVPILPIHAETNRAWRLRSWDRFLIPKPFAKVRVGYGDPFTVAPGDEAKTRAGEQAEAALRTLEEEIGWPAAAAMVTG